MFFITINRTKTGSFQKVTHKILKKYIFFYFDAMADIARVHWTVGSQYFPLGSIQG